MSICKNPFSLFFLACFLVTTNIFGQYADLGSGDLKNQIWWFNWNGFTITNGASKSFSTADGLVIQITFSNVTGQQVNPTIMDTWSGALLYNLYNFSDSNIKPALYALNLNSGYVSTYSLHLSATRNGNAVPFTIVTSDAEASSAGLENTTLITNGSNWITIDFFRNSSQSSNPLSGCGTQNVQMSDTYGNAIGIGQIPVLATTSPSTGIMDIAVNMNEGSINGGMGMAFGVFAPVDMGDLPASFGRATHAINYDVLNACSYNAPFPSIVQDTLIKLGSIAPDADATDTTNDNMRGIADEEAIRNFPLYNGSGIYSLNVKVSNFSNSAAYVSGWFDYNNDNVFEANEMSTLTVPVNDTIVTLIWNNLPSVIPSSALGFRFRISSDQNAIKSATGFASDGEVEDYQAQIMPNTTVIEGFNAPDTVCVKSLVTISNTSIGASSYYWNFCVANAGQAPTGINLGNINQTFNTPVYLDYVQTNGNYYGFVTNNYPGGLVRLDFGNSLLNTPTATSLGTLNGTIPTNTEGIQIVNNGGQWYLLIVGGDITDGVTPYILTVSLGANITNPNPVLSNWGNTGNLAYPHDLYVFNDNGHWYGITANTSNNTITRFDFGSDISNPPICTNLGNIGNLSGPTGIQAIEENGIWYLFVTNANSSTLSVLNFGNSLLNTPTGTNIGNPGNMFSTCWDIYVMKYCNDDIAYVINNNTGIYNIVKLDFGASLNNVPVASNLGNIGNLAFPHSISKIFRVNNDLYSFITNVNNNSLTRLVFNGCSSSTISGSTQQTPSALSYNTPGTYNINLTIDDGLPSQSSLCKEIVVINSLPVTITGDTIICKGDSTQLNVIGGTTYQWKPALGLSDTSIANPEVSPQTSTMYNVLVAEPGGCTASDSIHINVLNPIFNLSPIKNTVCIYDTVQFTASGGNQYQWIGYNQGILNTEIATLKTNLNVGVDTISVWIKDTICQRSDTLNAIIQVNPIPVVSIAKSNDIDCANGFAILSAAGGNTYLWSPVTGLSDPNISSPVVIINKTITYSVKASDSIGCYSMDSITVNFSDTEAALYLMPNAFTPNGDGLNDCFGLKNWGNLTSVEFAVYNRWGQRIFMTNDPAGCWDGTFNGIAQPAGTYVYHIKASALCGNIERKGTIVLIR